MGVTDAVDEVDVEPGKPTTAKVGDGIRLALGIITPPFFVLLLSTELMVPRIQFLFLDVVFACMSACWIFCLGCPIWQKGSLCRAFDGREGCQGMLVGSIGLLGC